MSEASVDILAWMREANITPRYLAEELGLSRAAVSALIAGDVEPDRLTKWAVTGLQTTGRVGDEKIDGTFKSVRPLNENLADERWAGETARLAMPVLIAIAKNKKAQTITYGDLHDKVVSRGGKVDVGTLPKYAYPCGRIAHAAEESSAIIGRNVPPLTAIVVNGTTGLPSDGIDSFLHHYLGHSERSVWVGQPSKRRAAIEKVWRDIFRFNHWDEVQEAVGLSGDPNYDR